MTETELDNIPDFGFARTRPERYAYRIDRTAGTTVIFKTEGDPSFATVKTDEWFVAHELDGAIGGKSVPATASGAAPVKRKTRGPNKPKPVTAPVASNGHQAAPATSPEPVLAGDFAE
jgi:hypothetical protein